MPQAHAYFSTARAERLSLLAMGKEIEDVINEAIAEAEAEAEARMSPAERAERAAQDKELDDLLAPLDDLRDDTDDDQPEPEPTVENVEPAEPALQHDNDNPPASFPQPSTTPSSMPETGAKPKANFPQKPRRRSQSRDREAVVATRHYGLSTVPVSALPICHTSSTPPHPSLSTDPHDSLTPTPSVAPASEFHLPTAANDNKPHLRIWENSTDYIKLIYSNRALANHGTPYHFTLNFGPKVAKAALKAKKGIRPFIANRLQKELKKIGRDGAFWCVLDVTPSGRIHAHGGVALDPSQEGAARALLHKAAGEWGSNYHKERQVDLDEQTDVDGWIDRYCFRKIARSRNLIGENSLYIARPLRQIAKTNYERDRSIINSQQRSKSSSSPSLPSANLVLFAATGADHNPHSSPVVPATRLCGVALHRRRFAAPRAF
jgi:hypothetical protein